MGILRDVLDTVKDISSVGNVADMLTRKRYSSISKRSLEGTLQFPVLVSKSMDIDTLQMISKGLERQFSSFVQIALTMSPAMHLDSDRDAAGYLRRFHQNSNVKTDLRDVLNVGTDLLESYNVYANNEMVMFATVCEGTIAKVSLMNKQQLEGILESVRQDVLNNKFIPARPVYRFANESLTEYHNRPVLEANGGKTTNVTNNTNMMGNTTTNTSTTTVGDVRIDNARMNIELRGAKFGGGGGNQRSSELPKDILKDNDARKANELVPTTMHIRVKIFNKEDEEQGTMDFIIGVKSTMHPIASDEMVDNMVAACKNSNKFFNFVRWTSGEINFFKDFVLNLSEIKKDVLDRSAGASPWWITLKRRRKLASMKEKLFMPNQILPNASIVVSMEEVELIKTQYGFDLMNPTFVDKIMKEYFLLSFVVVDNSAQIAHFMFDGQDGYQTLTFGALEKENTNKADMKEVMKIINRSNMI